jgi:hypothetical protein
MPCKEYNIGQRPVYPKNQDFNIVYPTTNVWLPLSETSNLVVGSMSSGRTYRIVNSPLFMPIDKSSWVLCLERWTRLKSLSCKTFSDYRIWNMLWVSIRYCDIGNPTQIGVPLVLSKLFLNSAYACSRQGRGSSKTYFSSIIKLAVIF